MPFSPAKSEHSDTHNMFPDHLSAKTVHRTDRKAIYLITRRTRPIDRDSKNSTCHFQRHAYGYARELHKNRHDWPLAKSIYKSDEEAEAPLLSEHVATEARRPIAGRVPHNRITNYAFTKIVAINTAGSCKVSWGLSFGPWKPIRRSFAKSTLPSSSYAD
ncbi:unnamed protein product [Periconia digitata]|uniref:Uncharacterized protein n=1 Tax=Periconia digitata TaxID=1303443 RepID=A0A9W4XUA8_9PLEO|nr:unnamed protein product [Periconia digitata]